jgi:hypothetical protein
MQADSLHRRETARSDGRQDCFASADYGTHRDAAAGVARRKPDGSFKGECEVEDLGVVERAQVSSAVEGLNRQRRQAWEIGSPVELQTKACRKAETEGMKQKTGR